MELKEIMIEACKTRYTDWVKQIIKDNSPYYRFGSEPQFVFDYWDDVRITASCSRQNNVIGINSLSVIRADADRRMLDIEYFILHEIRHREQHLMIAIYKSKGEAIISSEILEKWIFEYSHYEKATNDDGSENVKYHQQDSEMDAYAFSYAVMKYKYGEVDLYLPDYYINSDEFNRYVQEWIKQFEEEQIEKQPR